MSNRIKELREDRGWSQEDLAHRAGTTNQQISNLENGKRRLTQDWMKRLADALECHPLDILDGGPGRLKPREKEMIDKFRGMSEDQQNKVLGVIDLVAPQNTIHIANENNEIVYEGPERRLGGGPDYAGPERRQTHPKEPQTTK